MEIIAADANATDAGNPAAAGASSASGDMNEPTPGSADSIPIDGADVPVKDAGAGTGKKPDEKPVDGKPAGDPGKGAAAEAKPYHQDPDWQRMIKERDDAKGAMQTMQAKIDTLEKIIGGKAAPGEGAKPDAEKPTFKDITQMSKEELLEWQEDDPKGYAANMKAQVLWEARQELKAEQEAQSAQSTQEQRNALIGKTFKSFEEKNPDFRPMWDSGELKKFMTENPGHNAISAYHELTFEKRLKAAVDEAVAKTTKEVEERVTANFKAKRNAEVLGTGDGGLPPGPDDDQSLKDTKSHGGLINTLVERHRQRVAKSAGG